MGYMAIRRIHLELLCIICSEGGRDINGAFTVCALCELSGAAVPEAPPAAKAA